MMSLPDFIKKQIVFVFTIEGEKLSFKNDNLILTGKDNKIKLQLTCYRVFILFIIGEFSLTSGLIQKSHKFAFPIMPWSLKTTPNKNYTNTICMFEVHLMNKMHRKRIFIF